MNICKTGLCTVLALGIGRKVGGISRKEVLVLVLVGDVGADRQLVHQIGNRLHQLVDSVGEVGLYTNMPWMQS